MPFKLNFRRLADTPPEETPAESWGGPPGYDPTWRISADAKALGFLAELTDEEKVHAGRFMSKAIDHGFGPDQVQEMWCALHKMAEIAVNVAANHIHTQQTLDLLLSEKGWEWLMKENGKNLRLYFWAMKQGVGARR